MLSLFCHCQNLYFEVCKNYAKAETHINLNVNLSILLKFQRMKIWLVVSGKTVAPWLQQGLEEYLKRIKFYIPFEFKVIPELKNSRNLPVGVQKEKEGEALLSFLEGKNEVYLLDERGEEYASRELAGFLEKKMVAGCRDLIFVIGGPYGFSEKVSEQSTGKISLSKLTFSHQMVRLLFAEQLYRALSILRGDPYHHE